MTRSRSWADFFDPSLAPCRPCKARSRPCVLTYSLVRTIERSRTSEAGLAIEAGKGAGEAGKGWRR